VTARRHKVIVTSSLHNVADRSAIDLQVENYIPSKARTPQNNQAPTWLSGASSDRDYANEDKNQTECIGGSVS